MKKNIEYFLLFLLIASSGIPFFMRSGMAILVPIFLFSLILFRLQNLKIDKFLILYLLFYSLIQIIQTIKFNFLPYDTYIGLYLRVLIAFFIIKILDKKFISYYVNILVFLSIVSFIFFFPSLLFPSIDSFLINNISPFLRTPFDTINYSYHPDVILYTFNDGEALTRRNSGPFWEPGAFAGFLIVALIFRVIQRHKLLEWKTLILIIALISTLSTTGIIALMFFMAGYVTLKLPFIYKIVVVPLLIISLTFVFYKYQFLNEKITSSMSYQTQGYNTRFGSAMLDLKDWMENPVVGLGRNDITRFKGLQLKTTIHRNNGITNYLASYGFMGFLFYFFFIYYTLRKMCIYYKFNINFALFGIGLIFIIGFSEGYFTKPFFYSLTLLHLIFVRR